MKGVSNKELKESRKTQFVEERKKLKELTTQIQELVKQKMEIKSNKEENFRKNICIEKENNLWMKNLPNAN